MKKLIRFMALSMVLSMSLAAGIECCICSEEILPGEELKKGHFSCGSAHSLEMHERCVMKWIGHSSDRSCPLCRASQSSELREASASLLLQFREATRQVDISKMRDLIFAGVNINAKYVGGPSLLHLAARGGHAGAVYALIQLGANLNIRGSNQDTPLHEAAIYGREDVFQELIVAGAFMDQDLIHEAAKNGKAGIVRILLALGVEVNSKNREGFTAFHYASLGRHSEVMQLLLEAGARR